MYENVVGIDLVKTPGFAGSCFCFVHVFVARITHFFRRVVIWRMVVVYIYKEVLCPHPTPQITKDTDTVTGCKRKPKFTRTHWTSSKHRIRLMFGKKSLMSRSWQVSSVPWELHDMRKPQAMHQQLVLILSADLEERLYSRCRSGVFLEKLETIAVESYFEDVLVFRQTHLSFGMDVLFLISGVASLLPTLDGETVVLPRIHRGTSDHSEYPPWN